MKSAILRLVLAAVLFAAWIGWLVYLTPPSAWRWPFTPERPVVLSRPQFLISNLDVIAAIEEIDTNPTEVTVRDVFWPRNEAPSLIGRKIRVSSLPECRDDWIGPGEYILALMTFGENGYQVAPLPRSPGFTSVRRRIYPSTPQTQAQVREIVSRKP